MIFRKGDIVIMTMEHDDWLADGPGEVTECRPNYVGHGICYVRFPGRMWWVPESKLRHFSTKVRLFD